jgi:hydroxyethylthiazole kinase-like uncharacterized protein yjeF
MPRFSHETPIYRTEDIRRIEALAAAADDPPPLMERAGLAAADLAREMAASGKPVLVLAGPGNNGGDAFVVARHLKSAWFNVQVLFTGEAGKLSRDAARAFEAWTNAGGVTMNELPHSADCGLVVDGLFGIGLQRNLTGRYEELVSWINSVRCPVLALDVPSGLESDSGRVLGTAVRATRTVTFIGLKPGLLTLDGPDHCGDITLATLGLDPAALVPPSGHTIGPEALRRARPPPPRPPDKGE